MFIDLKLFFVVCTAVIFVGYWLKQNRAKKRNFLEAVLSFKLLSAFRQLPALARVISCAILGFFCFSALFLSFFCVSKFGMQSWIVPSLQETGMEIVQSIGRSTRATHKISENSETPSTKSPDEPKPFENIGQFGDSFGVFNSFFILLQTILVTAAGIITYRAFTAQKEQLKSQREDLELQHESLRLKYFQERSSVLETQILEALQKLCGLMQPREVQDCCFETLLSTFATSHTFRMYPKFFGFYIRPEESEDGTILLKQSIPASITEIIDLYDYREAFQSFVRQLRESSPGDYKLHLCTISNALDSCFFVTLKTSPSLTRIYYALTELLSSLSMYLKLHESAGIFEASNFQPSSLRLRELFLNELKFRFEAIQSRLLGTLLDPENFSLMLFILVSVFEIKFQPNLEAASKSFWSLERLSILERFQLAEKFQHSLPEALMQLFNDQRLTELQLKNIVCLSQLCRSENLRLEVRDASKKE